MSSVTYIFRYQALNLLETNMYGDLNDHKVVLTYHFPIKKQ